MMSQWFQSCAMSGLWIVAVLTIPIFADDTNIDQSQLPSLRLTGAQISEGSLSDLAGHDWDTVTFCETDIEAAIIESLQRTASVRTLRFFGRGISDQIDQLNRVNGLKGLEIGGTKLTSSGLEKIAKLKQLEHLALPQGMTINVTGARELAKMTQLISLNLCLVNIDDAPFQELKSLTLLETLDLSHTRVTDAGLRVLEQMPRLKTVQLYRHPEWQIANQLTDNCVRSLIQLRELETLSLSGSISDKGLAELVRLPKLKNLDVFGTAITGNGLSALEDSSVESLTVNSHQIGRNGDYTGAQKLKNCRRLKRVIVRGKFVTEADMLRLKELLPGIGLGFFS